MVVKVSLTKTGDRRRNVYKSLKLLEKEVKKDIGNKRIVIKPNFVSSSFQLAATHVDHIRGILDFLKPFHKKKIIIGECAFKNTVGGYKNFGYYDLPDEYNVELVDLNQDEWKWFSILDKSLKVTRVRVSKTIVDPKNYIISPAKLKTHDAVVVTLSLKNIVMGSIIADSRGHDKFKMHAGVKGLNYNLFLLTKLGIKPYLASIDGFVGMEGDGPDRGDPINVGVAIASTDFLAADRVGIEVMGVDASKVGYLTYCAQDGLGEYDLKKIQILGEKLEDCKKKFRLHSTVKMQYKWRTDAKIPYLYEQLFSKLAAVKNLIKK